MARGLFESIDWLIAKDKKICCLIDNINNELAAKITNELGTPSFRSDTLVNLPAAGQTGRMFISTDTFAFYRDNGTGWDLIGGPGIGTVTGSGTTNYLPKWTGSTALGNSLVFDNGTSVGIGTTTPDTTSVLTIQRGSKTENLWLTSSDGTNSIEFSNDAGNIRTGIQADANGLGFGGGASFRNALFIGRTTNRVLVNTTTDNGSTLRVNGNVNPNFLTFRAGGYLEFYTVADNDARGNTQRVVTGNIYRNISFGGAEYGAVSGIIKFGYYDYNTATFTSRGELSSTSWVFNELAANVDFRIESQTNANLFFVDASVDNIGIGTNSPNASALLDITSTTKGFLPPRMTGAQAEAITSPAEGLMVYSTDGSGTTITSKGWWGFEGATWVKLN